MLRTKPFFRAYEQLIPIEQDFSLSFICLEMRSILMQESSWEEFCSSVKVSLLWHLRISIDPNFQEILRFMHLKISIHLSLFDLYVIVWIFEQSIIMNIFHMKTNKSDRYTSNFYITKCCLTKWRKKYSVRKIDSR